MPTVLHSSLSSTELHEPKGVSSATDGEVYVADGSGSGSWQTPILQYFEDFNDTGNTQTLTSGTATKITNDGAGSFTNVTQRPTGATALWDTTNGRFDFSSLELGDTVRIRFDFDVTTSGANDEVKFELKLGVGGTPYDLLFADKVYKTAGTHTNQVFEISVYMGDTNTLDNYAEIYLTSDSAGDSVAYNGHVVWAHPRTPIWT